MKSDLHVGQLRRELPAVFEARRRQDYPWPIFEEASEERAEIDLDDLARWDGDESPLSPEAHDQLAEIADQAPSTGDLDLERQERARGHDLDAFPPPTAPPRTSGQTHRTTAVGPPPPFDADAWYQPFHYFPTDWGIFLREGAIWDLARTLTRVVWSREHRALTRAEAAECARAAVLILYEHEFFHHQTECFATREEVHLRHAVYVPQFSGPHWLLEEALANARAYGRVRYKGGAKLLPAVARAAQAYLELVFPASPPGYRDAIRYLKPKQLARGTRDLQERLHRAGGGPAGGKSERIWEIAPYAFTGFARKSSRIYAVVERGGRRKHPVLFLTFSSRDLAQLARQRGYSEVPGGGKGSHQKFCQPDKPPIVVPADRKDVPTGTARSILRDLGLTPREAMTMLHA
jgi:predicted RNA binding protein YcfA (HicA-like mRNA interferase family)